MRPHAFLISLISIVFIASPIKAFNELPDFSIEADSILFSNDMPVEGEPVAITVMVKNIGDAANMKDDVEVWFYEGKPEEGAIKMKVNAFFGLQPKNAKPIQANWRFRRGTTDVYVIVNPEGTEITVAEKSQDNNKGFKTITVTPRTYPQATQEQISVTIKKGVEWIRSQQGTHSRKCPQCETTNPQLTPICVICTATLKGLPVETEKSGVWYFGLSKIQETGLAVLTLLSAGVPESDRAVQNGLNFIINETDWNNFNVYDAAIVTTMLVATGNREKYFDRVRFAVNCLIEKQSSVEKGYDMRDDGGWGYNQNLADGAHMQYVIYALYAAKQWGISIPQKVWDKSVSWVRRNQDAKSGGWYYNQVQSPFAEGVYGTMTATGIMALKAAGVPPTDKQIQKGFEWLEKYYTITSNPGAFSWQYYYLLSLERAFDLPPKQEILAGHNWYEEIASLMVAEQQPDGKWVDVYEQMPTAIGRSDAVYYLKDEFSTTCFAILFLARAVPKPSKLELGVTSDGIQFSPPSPRAEEPINITASIINSGAEVEGIAEVAFYDGHPEKGGKQIGLIEVLLSPSHPNVNAPTSWSASKAGLHHIFAQIDPFNKIAEENKDNNIAGKDILIRPKSDKPVDAKLIKEIEKGVFQLGNVIVDTNTREITAPGSINMANNIIEYFACAKLGKTHESLMVLDVEPIHLQVVLLSPLGMKEGSNLRMPGDPRIPQGDQAEIWVEWELAGKRFRRRAEDLIYNAKKKSSMQHTNWVFTGARIVGNVFTAQAYKNIIAIYRDPDAIFNHPLEGGKDDTTYYVNSEVVPPVGTKVKVIIKQVKYNDIRKTE